MVGGAAPCCQNARLSAVTAPRLATLFVPERRSRRSLQDVRPAWRRPSTDHRRPLRRTQSAGHARAAGRGARAAVARARGRHRRALVEGPAGAAPSRRWARWRARTSTTTSTSPAARGAILDDRRIDGRRRRARPRPRCGARLAAVPAPAARQPPQHRSTTTTSATRSTGCGSTRGWSIRAPISATTPTTLDDAQAAQARPHLPQAAARARASASSTSAAAGAALLFHAAERYGVRRARHHAVAEPVRARARARSRRAASPAACASSCATTSTCPTTRTTTRSRASACSSTSACARFARYFGKIHRVLKPGGMVLNHGITHNTLDAPTAWAAASATSSTTTCFPAAS